MKGRLAALSGYESSTTYYGVSCASRSLCVAIGQESYGSEGEREIVERWNGARWLAQPAATVPYDLLLSSGGVGCTALLMCTIVAATDPYVLTGPPESSTFAERVSGTDWSVEPTPNPQVGPPAAFTLPDSLTAVSCVASTCIAVGSASEASGQAQMLIEQYP